MVVVISDVSELRLREESEREQRDVVALLGAFVRDRAGFVSFCEDTESWIVALSAEPAGEVSEQLEQLHTLKGNAGVYQLRGLAEAAEAVEARCNLQRRAPDAQDAARLAGALERALAPIRSLLGHDGDHTIQLRSEDFAAIEQALRAEEPRERVLERLMAASAEPAERVFARFATRLELLARRLGKAELVVACDGAGLKFPRRSFAPLWATLVHVLRNIADHGLETAWEREQSGKTRTAHVRFSARLDGTRLLLSLSDDGRGIDWERVSARAAQQGLPHQTRAQLEAALLQHGFTTLAEASSLSGRGVGLSAVASEARRLGGCVHVESEPGRGTNLLIELPRALLAA
jgi:two-component system chemotaxis sensor kinase CheA